MMRKKLQLILLALAWLSKVPTLIWALLLFVLLLVSLFTNYCIIALTFYMTVAAIIGIYIENKESENKKNQHKVIILILVACIVGACSYKISKHESAQIDTAFEKNTLTYLGNKQIDLFNEGILKTGNVGCVDWNTEVYNIDFHSGDIFYFVGQYDWAIESYEVALADFENSRSRKNITNRYIPLDPKKFKDYDDDKWSPEQYEATLYYHLGFAYAARGDKLDGVRANKSAIKALEKSIKIKKDLHIAVYQNLSRLYAENREFERAEEILNKAKEVFKSSDIVTYNCYLHIYELNKDKKKISKLKNDLITKKNEFHDGEPYQELMNRIESALYAE